MVKRPIKIITFVVVDFMIVGAVIFPATMLGLAEEEESEITYTEEWTTDIENGTAELNLTIEGLNETTEYDIEIYENETQFLNETEVEDHEAEVTIIEEADGNGTLEIKAEFEELEEHEEYFYTIVIYQGTELIDLYETTHVQGTSYEITNLTELQTINDDLDAHYILMNDINASETESWNKLNWTGTWEANKEYTENDYIEESGNYYYQLQDSYTSGSSFDSSQWIETTEFTGGSADDGEALGWRPLGWREFGSINAFSGSFDGQGHTISNLYINRGQENNAGMFGYTDGSTIENVGLEDVDVSKSATSEWYRATGGLVGLNRNSATVQNSYATGDVSGDTTVGGLVGLNRDSSTVSNSYATGDVSGERNTGGLVGLNRNSATVSNSYATGNVSGENNVGGLVGSNRNSATVQNSYSTGDVSGDSRAGGLVGFNRDSSTVQNSYSTGTVSGSDMVGGLVGYNWDGTVKNSYATGDVTGDDNVGGLVGRVYNEEGKTDEILYSYANSDINPDLDLIGADDTSGTLNTTGSSLKTTAEFTSYSTFDEWDITTVEPGETDDSYTWNIVDGHTEPFLSFEENPLDDNDDGDDDQDDEDNGIPITDDDGWIDWLCENRTRSLVIFLTAGIFVMIAKEYRS